MENKEKMIILIVVILYVIIYLITLLAVGKAATERDFYKEYSILSCETNNLELELLRDSLPVYIKELCENLEKSDCEKLKNINLPENIDCSTLEDLEI